MFVEIPMCGDKGCFGFNALTGGSHGTCSLDTSLVLKRTAESRVVTPPPKRQRVVGKVYTVKGGTRKKWYRGRWGPRLCYNHACNVQPSFGHEADGLALCCKEHKEADMVDVVSKTCRDSACKKHPSFGHEADGLALCCKEHKEVDMVDVKHTTCRDSACNVRPSFGHEADGLALCCKEHKEADMVDVVSKTCRDPSCETRANYYGYCAPHAVQAGLHFETHAGCSMIACDCFDRMARLKLHGAHEWTHQHYSICPSTQETIVTPTKEPSNLIPGRKLRPDAWCETTRTVAFFHGNYYHGYPPNHPKHATATGVGGSTSPELYTKTMRDMQIWVDHGWTVCLVWEHRYRDVLRTKCPIPMQKVVERLI